MQNFKGPSIYRAPDAGVRYCADPDHGLVHVTIKVSSDDHSFTQFSVVQYEVAENGRIPVHSYRSIERLLICKSGQGRVRLGDQTVDISCGAVVFCGHGVPLEIDNAADEPLDFFITSYPPGPESRADYLVKNEAGELVPELSDEARRVYGVLKGQEALDFPSQQRGHVAYTGPDEGMSYWQAAPSAGHITVKLAPPEFPLNHFGVATQLLEPGAFVREHGHVNTDELICVVEGDGRVFIDDIEHDFSAGSVAVLGRNVLHRIYNDGAGQFQMVGVFNPPGIERALSITGVQRTPGSERPTDIPRNAETGRLLVEQFGFVIPGGGG